MPLLSPETILNLAFTEKYLHERFEPSGKTFRLLTKEEMPHRFASSLLWLQLMVV